MEMSDLLDRVAGAPITWGVDGSPGWGYLMGADRVLSEMVGLGLGATELGPRGFLPTDPAESAAYVDNFGLSIVGGFVPAILYLERGIDEQLESVDRASHQLARCGATQVVLGPDSHHSGYDTEIDMDDDQWRAFLENLRRVEEITSGYELTTALHPHWGMAIAREHHVDRFLNSCETSVCLDTGHLFLGGVDPLDVARAAGDRVVHVHLKDLDNSMAERVRAGEIAFRQATIDGMFKPVGAGDVDIAGVIRHLEGRGYRGWYVLEQDCSLTGEPDDGEGPLIDARASVEFLRELAADL
jgi:inosose dehydratase